MVWWGGARGDRGFRDASQCGIGTPRNAKLGITPNNNFAVIGTADMIIQF